MSSADAVRTSSSMVAANRTALLEAADLVVMEVLSRSCPATAPLVNEDAGAAESSTGGAKRKGDDFSSSSRGGRPTHLGVDRFTLPAAIPTSWFELAADPSPAAPESSTASHRHGYPRISVVAMNIAGYKKEGRVRSCRPALLSTFFTFYFLLFTFLLTPTGPAKAGHYVLGPSTYSIVPPPPSASSGSMRYSISRSSSRSSSVGCGGAGGGGGSSAGILTPR